MTTVMVRSPNEIPDADYRKMVLTLMDKQTGREVATAEVFGQCVLFAPTIEDKIRITRFQHEELKHYQLLARLMSELGIDMEAYLRDRQRAGARFTGDEADIQIQDWIDATLFNFMIDRGATFQLTEYTRSSYLPLARANEVILKEEEGHKNFGEECLEQMCRDPATRAEISARAVSIKIGVRTPAARRRRHTSSPSTLGIMMSSTAASGWRLRTLWIASVPSCAVSTS